MRIVPKTGELSIDEKHVESSTSSGAESHAIAQTDLETSGRGLGLALRAPLAALKRSGAALLSGAMLRTKTITSEKPLAAPSIAIPSLDAIASSGVNGLELRVRDPRVDGQRVVLRRIVHPKHGAGVEVLFRLASDDDIRSAQTKMGYSFLDKRIPNSDRHADFRLERGASEVNMHRLDLPSEHFDFWEAKPSAGGGLELLRAVSLRDPPQLLHPYLVGCGKVSEEGRHDLEVVDATAGLAFRGLVRLRSYGDEAGGSLRQILGTIGLEWVLDPADNETRQLAGIRTAVAQRAPEREAALRTRSGFDEVYSAARKAGLSSAEIAHLEEAEVFPGYSAPVLPEREQLYRQLGVKYLFTGVSEAKTVVDILNSQGMTSPLEAGLRGRAQSGEASVVDINFGGARGVFLRIATDAARGVLFERSSFHRKYQLAFDPGLMARCDWYAFTSDMYGRSDEFGIEERKQGRALIRGIGKDPAHFASNNEIIFPVGVSSRHLRGILTQSEDDRRALIDEMRAAGVNDINGLPIQDAVQVRKVIIDENGTIPFAAQLAHASSPATD